VLEEYMDDDELVQFNVYLPKGLVERFRKMISLKYQTQRRGLISYEVKEALNSWMAMVGTQTQSTQKLLNETKVNPIPVVHQLKKDICNYLLEVKQMADVPQFIPHKFLIEAISSLKGIDLRTVKKWLNLLKQYGCIKQVGDYQWEIT
jgi:hypothetical protein